MKKKQIVVVAAIISKVVRGYEKYLITQRLEGDHLAEKWEFPGGKVEFGEDPIKCLKKELLQELGVGIEVVDFFGYSSTIYDNILHVILIGFRSQICQGSLNKFDVKDYKWISPEQMANYDFCKADRPFVKKLQELSS